MPKYRLLVRTIDGNRVSNQLTLIDAAKASAIYKALHPSAPVEVIPDNARLCQAYEGLDRAAPLKIQESGADVGVVWDRRFCLQTAAEPRGRIEPTPAAKRGQVVSPESHLPGWLWALGYIAGLTLLVALLPLLALYCLLSHLFHACNWLVEPAPEPASEEGFLRAPSREAGPC